ncbi:MAG: DNA topoisomerase, partial [Chloroflexota bacterium]
YKLSPLLWHKIKKGISAGRVQSAALRMVVDREREIQKFVRVEYWTIEALFAKRDGVAQRQSFAAQLHSRAGEEKRIQIPDQRTADLLKADMEGAAFAVKHVYKKEIQRRPAAPYTTSTLQQEASRRLGYSAQRTMALAQQLYEGLPLGGEGPVGLITYMRTDSVHVAASAKEETRHYIGEKFGQDYLPPHARVYTAKSKLAQEAHEAIRPTSAFREPAKLRHFLTREQLALYDLVWKRMVASQMANALVDQTSVDIDAAGRSGAHYMLRASGSKVRFPGFLTLYTESRDEDAKDDEGKQPLPDLKPHDPLDCKGITPEQHFTEPPPRFTEATLIKALEENGIGRPSTYAPIIVTLTGREYVKKLEGRL